MYSYVQPHALEINPKVKLKGSKGQTLSQVHTYLCYTSASAARTKTSAS